MSILEQINCINTQDSFRGTDRGYHVGSWVNSDGYTFKVKHLDDGTLVGDMITRSVLEVDKVLKRLLK